MCNVLLRDPLNRLWQMSVLDQGNLVTGLTALNSPYPNNPILNSGSNYWQLAVTIQGNITSTKVGATALALPYIPMTSTGGVNYKFIVRDQTGAFGVINTSLTGLLPDFIPYSTDVSMSRWPDSIGVFCATCGNATVTVSADLSNWCCSCNAFVKPEDTNVLVVLDE